ncbi:MAG: hypothetical protein N2645_03475 [Clostridia bacterium]|nr:hypothetical protein [Clostridia bacterium]
MRYFIENKEIFSTMMNLIIIPLIPYLTKYLIAYIRQKTDDLEAKIKYKEIKEYVHIAEEAVISAVATVNQIYVDEIKKNNGVFLPHEQKIAFDMAKEKVVKILGETGLKVLGEVYNDLNVWLESRIEYYVNELKNKQTVLLPVK